METSISPTMPPSAENHIERLPLELLHAIFSRLSLREIILLGTAADAGPLAKVLEVDPKWREAWRIYQHPDNKTRFETFALFRISLAGKWTGGTPPPKLAARRHA
ncbi:hypothetical protein OQA88_13 [Cercophora sp. LCS_1]